MNGSYTENVDKIVDKIKIVHKLRLATLYTLDMHEHNI
jgi:hypothetical protein